MAHELALSANKRTNIGKTPSKQLRKDGIIPAILYAKDKTPVMVEVNHKEWFMTFRDQSTDGVIVNLDIKDGDKAEQCACLIKEVQIDRISGKCIHIDFLALDLSKPIRTEVHVETVGEAAGVLKNGGILEHIKRTVEIECLPRDLPEVIEVDISALGIDDSICVGDLKLGEGIKVLSDPEAMLVCIVAPKEEKEPEEGAEPTSAEPEVIAKGKKEEEEE